MSPKPAYKGKKNHGPHKERRPAKETGAIAELPVLLYTENIAENNFQAFRDALQLYAMKEFGDLGLLIENEQYYVPEEIEIPDADTFSAENDPGGFKAHHYKTLIAERCKLMRSMENKRLQLFSVILGQLSTESKTRIRQLPKWTKVVETKDPLALWKLVVRVHGTGSKGQKSLDYKNVRDTYNALRQGPTESLADYHLRFTRVLERFYTLKVDMPPEDIQAVDFIHGLDGNRYATFVAELENACNVFTTVTYPTTLTAAYDMVSRYKVTKQSRTTSGTTVFMTSADTQHTSTTNKKNNKSNEQKSEKSNDQKADKSTEKQKGKSNNGTRTSSGKKQGVRTPTCSLCQQEGHWPKDCEWLAKCRETISSAKSNKEHTVAVTDSVVFTVSVVDACALASALSTLGRYDVLLDNQASTHVFKEKKLISNIRESDCTLSISGIAGDTNLTSNLVGDHPLFGEVCYCPGARANVLCYAKVRDMYGVQYDSKADTFIVPINSRETLRFRRRDNIYPCDFSKSLQHHHCLSTTVEENESMYTKREVVAAKQVKEISAQLGYPSPRDLIDVINAGSIINLPITARDVERAYKIYGPDLAAVKGKTTSRKAARANPDVIVKRTREIQTLSVDVMFVNGDPYLISVSTPMGLTMVNALESRAYKQVSDALSEQLNRYKSEGFVVTTVFTDGEGAIAKMEHLLRERGISINTTGAGQHVPTVERKIRVIKERCRGIYNTLPFRLRKIDLKWLINYAVTRINLLPTSTSMSRISPREQFTGRKADYYRDVRVSFGQYCQVHEPDTIDKNNLKSRTAGAIALLPTGNLQGSVKFLSLSTGKVITRDHWTPLPMPSDVVQHLNNISNLEWKEGMELTFSINDAVVDADITASNSSPPDMPEEKLHDGVHSNDLSVGGDDERLVHEPTIEQPEAIPDITESNDNDHIAPEDPTHMLETADTNDATATEPENCGSVSLELTDTPIQAQPVEPEGRYSLRKRLDKDSKAKSIQQRKDYCSLHISVKKGIQKFGVKALEAIVSEMQQMLDKKVFHPVDVKTLTQQQRKSIIRSSIFLKEKFISKGVFDKLKGRLVAGGHMQDKSLYDDNSSPTVSTMSVFMLSTIAAHEERHVVTADIGGAYLNASMGNYETFMKLDAQLATILSLLDDSYEKYVNEHGELVVKLDKALYGCVQSAKLWYEHLRGTLESMGFKINPSDICVFNKGTGTDQCSICTHVDDLKITCKNIDVIDEVLRVLTAVYKDVKIVRGVEHSYLGMTFDYSDRGRVKITMEGYIHDLLCHYQVTKHATTPATAYLYAIRDSKPLQECERQEFHSAVAKLLYLAKRVRPEILTAVSYLASRVTCATEDDMSKLQRIFAYLNNEPNLGLILEAGGDIQLHAYIDASFGVHHDGKSHTGGVISMGGGATYVKSAKQRLVSKSSTEAELIALSDTLSNVIWHRDFLLHQGYVMKAANVYQDNTSTIALAEKGRSTSERTRHVNVRYFFVKDRIENGEIIITYLPTSEMVADILTKPLQGELFRNLRNKLLNCEALHILDD